MTTKVFVNLPVADLERAKSFYSNVGFAVNPKYTDSTAACIDIDDDIHVMLLTHEKFKEFTPNGICDARKQTEVLVGLSRNSRAAVDDLVSKAFESGGRVFRDPQDYGFMYGHAFQDPDGHIWELLYLEPQETAAAA